MTIEFLEKRIEELAEAESRSACCRVAAPGYFEGFDAACAKILKIIREEEDD